MTAAVIIGAAAIALAWFAYQVGEHTGARRGRREGRRLAWRDRDEHWPDQFHEVDP